MIFLGYKVTGSELTWVSSGFKLSWVQGDITLCKNMGIAAIDVVVEFYLLPATVR